MSYLSAAHGCCSGGKRQRLWLSLGRLGLGLLVLGGWIEIDPGQPWGQPWGLSLGHPAQAQVLPPGVKEDFLADPLADNPRDPLLPMPVVDRPLSPLEQLTLEQDLNQLAREATALAEANQPEAAAALWMREIRLRRVLGLEAELEAMGRVAPWFRDRIATQDLQRLSARLDQITPSQSVSLSADRERLAAIALIYTILGQADAAALLHRSLADAALDRGDTHEHQAQLEALARIYADWFYFPEAASVYGELVAITEGDDEIPFLVGQIENLGFAQRFEAALTAQQHLLNRYRADAARWVLVADLQYAMAQNYQRVGDLAQASRYYQVAYTNAIEGGQVEIAAQTLRALAHLYHQLEQWPDVDYLYQQLLAVERQALDAYGLMDTFNQLGQLYEQTDNPAGARQAYTEGLTLAHQLHHRQDYFLEQIQRLTAAP